MDQKPEKIIPVVEEAGGDLLPFVDADTTQIDNTLVEKFERAIHKQTGYYLHSELAKIAVEHDPFDLANASLLLPPSARLILYRNLPDIDARVSFIQNVSSPTRHAIFRGIRNEEICRLLENMPADDAVSIVDDLSTRRVKHVFEMLEPQKARKILALRQHMPQTAGRLMSNEFFTFPLDTTVHQVSEFIRDHPGIEFTNWIFVSGEDSELLGYVSDRNLIVNSSKTPLRAIMRPIVHRVDPDTSRDVLVEMFERYRLPALAVVDENDRLLGVITEGDVVTMIGEIADETIASIGGTTEDVSEDETTIKRFCSRAPWLLVTLVAGLTTATGFSIFQGQPWFLAVPFFVPLIAGMSGNVGIQCSSVLVRTLALGTPVARRTRSVLYRELKIGALIGVLFGLICGGAAFFLNRTGIQQSFVDPFLIGSMVSAGVLGACITATVLGTMLPIFFERRNIDPAVASGPIVAACNDVASTYMFFFLAWSVATLFELIG